MAQVSISVADIQIGIEDEDASAKALKRLGLKTIVELVAIFGVESKPDEVEEATLPYGQYRCCGEVFQSWQNYNGHVEMHLVKEAKPVDEEDADG